MINKDNIEYISLIGKGGFSKVWKIKLKLNNKIYALKEMNKLKIIDKKAIKSINNEKKILTQLNSHPFIVNIHFSFQDNMNLYLILDFLPKGDIRYHLQKNRKFSEIQTKFLLANIILGLEHIHKNNIIHRDLKPENLLFDKNGYIKISDFGIAKYKKLELYDNSGTPGYMSPEVIFEKNHSFISDFFAIGVMGYESMFGFRPYFGRNKLEIKNLMMKKQAIIIEKNLPHFWTKESMDFINNCLKINESKRLGYNKGIIELKNHIWFEDINWENLFNKLVKSPFIFEEGDLFNNNIDENEKFSEYTIERFEEYKKRNDYNILFKNYTFINDNELSKKIEEENSKDCSQIKNEKIINNDLKKRNQGKFILYKKNILKNKFLNHNNSDIILNNEKSIIENYSFKNFLNSNKLEDSFKQDKQKILNKNRSYIKNIDLKKNIFYNFSKIPAIKLPNLNIKKIKQDNSINYHKKPKSIFNLNKNFYLNSNYYKNILNNKINILDQNNSLINIYKDKIEFLINKNSSTQRLNYKKNIFL